MTRISLNELKALINKTVREHLTDVNQTRPGDEPNYGLWDRDDLDEITKILSEFDEIWARITERSPFQHPDDVGKRHARIVADLKKQNLRLQQLLAYQA
jgi:broad specificity phosphatase PhoE